MFAEEALVRLREVVGEAFCRTDAEALAAVAGDATLLRGSAWALVRPGSVAEVQSVLRVAWEFGVPVVPRGGGTGLSGGAVPQGGLVLSLDRLRELHIHADDLQAVAQAGVVTADLQRAAAAHGLFFPPEPSSSDASTVGGNVAENAGANRSLKYGTTRDYVLELEVVLADGRLLRTGGRTRKNVTGYDLKSLFVGSEGTLGVITEARLQLLPRAPATATALGVFDRLENLGLAVVRTVRSPLRAGTLASLEFLDRHCVAAVEDREPAGLPRDAAGVLLAELEGWPGTLLDPVADLTALWEDCGAREVRAAVDAAGQRRLWAARRSTPRAVAALRPAKISEDATVPLTAVPIFLETLEAIRARHGVELVVFGHVGDGNFHPCLLCDPADGREMARVQAAIDDLFAAALSLGGTLSGEHGIGLLKVRYMEQAVAPDTLAVLRAVKAVLDPKGILNPGKLLPGPLPGPLPAPPPGSSAAPAAEEGRP
ncbi:MAG: FAD-binding protein [Clostridia bacterium]|nr:FAD-binding protein [Clostridia bacterium]